MSENIAQDNIVSTEHRKKNARRILEEAILEEAIRKESEQRSLRPTSIWPAGTFNTEDIPQEPNNWLYDALSDPQLNRGLENLAVNAADVLLGRESGNPLVDLGTSNIPGVGAASILAAGGMPGIVDAVGMGELKNMKRIPKYTYEFVKEFFGDKGLKNLDNALTKYPKAEKPNLNDAIHILKTGLGGETVNAMKPYRSTDAVADLIDMEIGNAAFTKSTLSDDFKVAADAFRSRVSDAGKMKVDKLVKDFYDALEENNAVKLFNSMAPFQWAQQASINLKVPLEHAFNVILDNSNSPFRMNLKNNQHLQNDKVKRYVSLDSENPQDWEKIAADQKYLDEHPEIVAEQARKGEEAALKAKLSKMSKKERKAYEEKLRKQQQQQQKAKPQAQRKQAKAEVPLQEKVPQAVQETVKGGPNMWKENGWNPNVRTNDFYSQFGGNLSDNSKRDAFVIDSLANYWARQIVGEGKEGKLSAADIVDALDRADARHKRSNYDEVSRGFYDDIKKNIGTGNMPGTSVMFGPKYKRNVRTDRDTPTLILSPEEKPRFYNDVRIWADEQDGPDIYEMIFRPKTDRMLNSLNPEYWLYNRKR